MQTTSSPTKDVRGTLTGGLLTFDMMHAEYSLEGRTLSGDRFYIEGAGAEGGARLASNVVHQGQQVTLRANAIGSFLGGGTVRVGSRVYSGLKFFGELSLEGTGTAGALTDVTPAGTARVRACIFGTYGDRMMTGPESAQVRVEAEGTALALLIGSALDPRMLPPSARARGSAYSVQSVRYVVLSTTTRSPEPQGA